MLSKDGSCFYCRSDSVRKAQRKETLLASKPKDKQCLVYQVLIHQSTFIYCCCNNLSPHVPLSFCHADGYLPCITKHFITGQIVPGSHLVCHLTLRFCFVCFASVRGTCLFVCFLLVWCLRQKRLSLSGCESSLVTETDAASLRNISGLRQADSASNQPAEQFNKTER